MIVMCSGCGRVRTTGETYTDLGTCEREKSHWAPPVDPDPLQPGTISRTLCPDCEEKENRVLDQIEAIPDYVEIDENEGDSV